MNPLFNVGEVVILASRSSPHLTGEYSVLLVVPEGGEFRCPITQEPAQDASPAGSGFGYVLDDGDLTAGGICHQWHQSALRKKHQPGEQSFAELMQTLKSPVSV